jgi:hypothetical protein
VADTVTEPNSANTLPPVSVTALLDSAMRARKSGNTAAARALLRALSSQQPDLPQVWLVLATVAETRAEQRRALERVLALDPRNEPARRGLARIGTLPASAPAAPTSTAASAANDSSAAAATPPIAERDQAIAPAEQAKAARAAPALRSAEIAPESAEPNIRWPLYLVIGVSALVVLIAAILIRGSEFAAALRPAPTAALPGFGAARSAAPAPGITPAPALARSAAPAAGAGTLPSQADTTAAPATIPPQATAPPPSPIPSPLPTPRQALAPGQIVEQGQWHAILIRPQDAVALDGSIGAFQPRGRFVLALVAVGNDGQAPARLPDDLFALVDGSGNRYAPLPQISTAYLNTYGRGQHGDLSMEDMIPSDGGNKSVPLIFDVPPSARPLYLLVGDSPAGWPIIP